MYTWEIVKHFESKNWILDKYEDFDKIFKKSPQIKCVKLEELCSDKAKYLIETNDNFSGWVWIKNKGVD